MPYGRHRLIVQGAPSSLLSPAESEPNRSSGRAFVWLALLGVTLLQAGYITYIRRASELAPLRLDNFLTFEFNPYAIGIVVQEVVIPLALLSLLSGAAFFQRLVTGRGRVRDRLWLFLALAVIQVLFFVYLYALNVLEVWQITRGYLLIIVAGLVGGTRLGLGIGALTFALIGTRSMLYWPPETYTWPWTFRGYYLFNPEASVCLWLGVSAGLVAGLLGKKRFVPVLALAFGFVAEALTRVLMAFVQDDTAGSVGQLIPVGFVSAVALAVFALVVRNVQASYAQRQADAAVLAVTQAELRALRAQINPHFLFNSLNTIRYFVRTRPDKARELLLNLSEVFQRALHSGEMIALRDELHYVEAYLSLEKARLDERLQVSWTLPSEALLETPVPTLVLQPLVENAVIHGISKKPEGGTLSVIVEPWGSDLVMQVRDDGVGFDDYDLKESLASGESWQGEPVGGSIGLRNINERLRLLYGDGYRLLLESVPGQGTRVQLRLPLPEDYSLPKVRMTRVSKPPALDNPDALRAEDW